MDGGRGGYGAYGGCGGDGGRGRIRIDYVTLAGQFPSHSFTTQHSLTNLVRGFRKLLNFFSFILLQVLEIDTENINWLSDFFSFLYEMTFSCFLCKKQKLGSDFDSFGFKTEKNTLTTSKACCI